LILAHGNQRNFDLQIHFFQNLFPNQNIGKSRQGRAREFIGNIHEDNHLSSISLPTNIFGKKGLAAIKHFATNIPNEDHLTAAR
jgi:hypothetical protein